MPSTPDKDNDDNDITHTDTWQKYGYYVTADHRTTSPEPPVKPVRSLAKAISWRIIASTDTFLISWLITGYWALATTIAGVEAVTKFVLYYFHERAWLRIKFRSPFH